MTVFVTGATGQLGGRVARRLIDIGTDIVVAVVRTPEKAEALAQAGAEVRRFDYDDPATMVQAMAGCDTIVLVPTFVAVESGAKRVLHAGFMSTGLECSFTVNPFLLYAESAVRQSGLEWTILRDGLYLDPFAEWVPEIVEMGRIPYPCADGKVAYISRNDIAASIAAAAAGEGHGGKLYALTGALSQDFDEIAETVSRVTGADVRYDPMSEEEFVKLCVETGMPDYIPAALGTLYRNLADGFLDEATSHVEELTGKPAESVEDYLRRTLA